MGKADYFRRFGVSEDPVYDGVQIRQDVFGCSARHIVAGMGRRGKTHHGPGSPWIFSAQTGGLD